MLGSKLYHVSKRGRWSSIIGRERLKNAIHVVAIAKSKKYPCIVYFSKKSYTDIIRNTKSNERSVRNTMLVRTTMTSFVGHLRPMCPYMTPCWHDTYPIGHPRPVLRGTQRIIGEISPIECCCLPQYSTYMGQSIFKLYWRHNLPKYDRIRYIE